MDNAEKNSYVKKQITNAILILLKEKELKDISISEITSTAQVSRISFYRNYLVIIPRMIFLEIYLRISQNIKIFIYC